MSLKLPGGIDPLAQASRQVRVEVASKSYLPSADSRNAYARQLDKQAVRLDRQNKRIDDFGARVDDLSEDVSAVHLAISTLNCQVDELGNEIAEARRAKRHSRPRSGNSLAV